MVDETTSAAPAASALAPASTPDLEARLASVIRIWRDELIANGPIARATECWNHLEAALGKLTASILKEL